MSSYKCYGPVKPIQLKAEKDLPERVCYDFYEGKEERISTGSQDIFLKNSLENKDQMLLWVQLAYQIFKSEPDSYWNHSKKSWEDNFGRSANYMDLIDCLCNKHDKTNGAGGDPYKSTGLTLAGCLNDVEQAAGKLIEELIGKKLKAKNFIERCNLEPFHDNTEKQTVYYTIAANSDKYGGTFQYGYNAFGLAFYNFRLKVVADETPYNTAIGNRTVEEAIKQGGIAGFTYQNTGAGESFIYPAENKSTVEASQTVETSSEITETESNSITNSEEYSFTEMIGMSMEIEDVLKVNKVTMEMQFTAGQVIGTAYSEEASVSKTNSNSSSITVVLPPHTALMVKQRKDNTVTTLEYDCPVMVQFDVAVFSMCGTCYDDNAAVQAFSTAGYDQRSFITVFQASSAGDAGQDGSENLYIRYKNSQKISGYDKTHGTTKLKSNKNGTLKDRIDWDVILAQTEASTNCMTEGKQAVTKKPKELIEQIGIYRPMSPTGATLTECGKSIVSTVESAIPIYPLYTLRQSTGNSCYDVGTGDVLYPENWTVAGYDTQNVPFYGFDSILGSWILVNEQGEKLKDDSIAGIYSEPLTNKPYIRGNAEGIVYAKYLIPDNYYYCQTGTSITNQSIHQTAFVKIVIHDTRLDGRIETEGSISVKNNTITNLEQFNGVNVHVYDETGTEIFVPVLWETEPGSGNGIMILGNQMSVSAVGTYYIRARYEGLLSDSIEVHVTE